MSKGINAKYIACREKEGKRERSSIHRQSIQEKDTPNTNIKIGTTWKIDSIPPIFSKISIEKLPTFFISVRRGPRLIPSLCLQRTGEYVDGLINDTLYDMEISLRKSTLRVMEQYME